MSLEVHCFDVGDVAAFLEKTESFLYAKADKHCQILGFVTAAQQPSPPPHVAAAVFAVATADGEPVAAVVWSPARITVSAGPEAAIRMLVTTLVKRGQAMSVLKGPVEAVDWFADEVGQAQGKTAVVTEEALLYRCDALVDDVKIPLGRLKQACTEDLERLCDIIEEEKGSVDREKWKELLADPDFCKNWFFWCSEDGVIVAKAKYIKWTSACAGVQGVYTSLDSRGKGYATGVMHGMCKVLLEQYKFLVLYVDKENGAANRVYQRIGFTVVDESKMVRFVDEGGA